MGFDFKTRKLLVAVRKKIWVYPDAAPTLTDHLNSGGNTLTVSTALDYLSISSTMTTLTNSYIYRDMSSITDYVIQSGDYLEYDIWWNGSGNIAIAMDLTVSDGGYLRDATAAVDDNGLKSHPDTDLSTYATGKWYRRRIPITSFSNGSSIGKTLQFYDLSCERNTAGTYTAQIKNVAITDGNGVGQDSIDTNTFSIFFND